MKTRQGYKNLLAFSVAAVLLCAALFLAPGLSLAQEEKESKIKLYIFWGEGCHNCEHAKRFLGEMEQKYPQLEVLSYEVWYNKQNAKLFAARAQAYDKTTKSVPAIFMGNKSWSGYRDDVGIQLEKAIKKCIIYGCPDPFEKEEQAADKPASSMDKVISFPKRALKDVPKAQEPAVLTGEPAVLDAVEALPAQKEAPSAGQAYIAAEQAAQPSADDAPESLRPEPQVPEQAFGPAAETGPAAPSVLQTAPSEKPAVSVIYGKLPKPLADEEYAQGDPTCVDIFLNRDCPDCEAVIEHLNALFKEFNLVFVWHYMDDEREKLRLEKFKKTYGVEDVKLPAVFIGESVLMGKDDIKRNLVREIISCTSKGCVCSFEKLQGAIVVSEETGDEEGLGEEMVTLPVFGQVNAAKMSLPVFTVIIGLLDGFNPCAFFVLFLLLGILVYAKSRRRILLIGGIFVFFSGLIYFLFMAAWLNLFLVMGQLRVITTTASVVALLVAVINIKDFFFFKKGISLVIPDKAKPSLYVRISHLARASSMLSIIAGATILAIAANTYELLCTAGFPMVFTRILTMHHIGKFSYYLYLLLYNAVYIVPLAVIVVIFAVTLGAKQLTEWQGRVLKLISGLMMFGLGLILLIKPALLNNVFIAGLLLVSALIVTGMIISLTKIFGPDEV